MTHLQGQGVKLVGVLVIFSLILMACQDQENNETQTPPQNNGPIEVAFKTDPLSDLQVGQPIELQAEVTRMGNVITDAEEVLFEIWEKKDEHHIEGSEQQSHQEEIYMDQYDTEHEMIEADYRGDGVYGMEIVFDQEGVYFVMYHVTVDDMHAMNKHEVVVK